MSKDPVSKTKDVRAAVDAELGFDPLVDAADITVRNIAGDVTLTGTVPSYPILGRRPSAQAGSAGSWPARVLRSADDSLSPAGPRC